MEKKFIQYQEALELKQLGMEEQIKNDVSVSSRLKNITDEEHLKIIDFIIDYSFKDSQEVYTNGTILVPLFRVLDAISQKGKQYQEGGSKWKRYIMQFLVTSVYLHLDCTLLHIIILILLLSLTGGVLHHFLQLCLSF